MKRSMSVMGYVWNDPELKLTQNGSQFVTFRLANSAFGDPKDATGKEISSWFNVTVYNPQLQKLAQTIKKGSCIDIIGDYKDRLYQSKDGSIQIGRDIIASAIYFGPSMKNDYNTQGQVAKPSVPVNPGIANPVTPVYPHHTVLNPATNPITTPNAYSIAPLLYQFLFLYVCLHFDFFASINSSIYLVYSGSSLSLIWLFNKYILLVLGFLNFIIFEIIVLAISKLSRCVCPSFHSFLVLYAI